MRIAFAFLIAAISSHAGAQCFGSSSFKTCNDSSGNSYTINKFGNQTNVQGYNYNTGSSWSQTSQTYGNTTIQNGISSDGGSWNQTIRSNSFGTTYSGSDSNGNSFYRHCTTYGCN